MCDTVFSAFTQPISEWVWRNRYRAGRDAGISLETRIEDTWERVAHALAQAEASHQDEWARRFLHALKDFRFLPGGRVLANAGISGSVETTLFNCFVMDQIPSETLTMMERLQESMLTLQAGGGIGCNFSLVSREAYASLDAEHASGRVEAVMKLWDAACAATTDSRPRRGAMMATLRDDHPDVLAFIDAKRSRHGRSQTLTHFNLSVLVSDALMHAVANDAAWPLVFATAGTVNRTVCVMRARELWQRLMDAAYESAEPGVIFIDRVRRLNNLAYCEQIHATNPCGEVPLPAYGACNLGSINLAKFVVDAFERNAHLDFAGIASTTVIATRMLDNVYEVSAFPLAKQAEVARSARRLGIGITGLADALAMLGLQYGSTEARDAAEHVMSLICQTAYRASTVLARERGAFPAFDVESYCAAPFVSALPADIVATIRKYGIRNSHLLAIAPTGSISLLANNVSSGIEPVFAGIAKRNVVDRHGNMREWEIEDYAWQQLHTRFGRGAKPTPALLAASGVDADSQLAMQSVLQRYVDSAISKTISVAQSIDRSRFDDLYRQAYGLGLKGCTVIRQGSLASEVVTPLSATEPEFCDFSMRDCLPRVS